MKAVHVVKTTGNVSSVREDFGDRIVLTIVQDTVIIVKIRINVIIAQMDGMVLLVISRVPITAEKQNLVTKTRAIAAPVLWGILVTNAIRTVVIIVTQQKCVTRKMEHAKNANPVERGHVVQKCAATNANIQFASEMSLVSMDVKMDGLVQHVQTNVPLPFEIVPNAKVSNLKQFVRIVLIPGI